MSMCEVGGERAWEGRQQEGNTGRNAGQGVWSELMCWNLPAAQEWRWGRQLGVGVARNARAEEKGDLGQRM